MRRDPSNNPWPEYPTPEQSDRQAFIAAAIVMAIAIPLMIYMHFHAPQVDHQLLQAQQQSAHR